MTCPHYKAVIDMAPEYSVLIIPGGENLTGTKGLWLCRRSAGKQYHHARSNCL